jgi:hypothetical protein
VVDTAPERHMATRDVPLEIDLVGNFEFIGVAIGGAPKQKHRGGGGDSDIAENRIPRCEPHHVTERRFEAENLFDERRDQIEILSDVLL